MSNVLPETAVPGQPRQLASPTIVVAIKCQLGQDKDKQDGFHGDDAHHVVHRRVLVVTVIRNVHRYQSLEQFAMKSSRLLATVPNKHLYLSVFACEAFRLQNEVAVFSKKIL